MYNTHAWCGGVMSIQGSFTIRHDKGVKFNMASTLRLEVIQGFAKAFDLNVTDTAPRGVRQLRIEVSNRRLHEIMRQLWPYLTDTRKVEYNKLLKEALEAGWQKGKMIKDIEEAA